MIYKNQTIGESDNVTVAEFGSGDILVGAAYAKNQPMSFLLLFNNDKVEEIGVSSLGVSEAINNGLPYEIVLSFTKVESIDVVVETLTKMKNKMLLDSFDEEQK
jgi:hypothetical protein